MVRHSPFLVEDDEGLKRIFEGARTIAVVGLSSDPDRPSHDVAAYLQRQGYRIVPVNPNEQEVLGEPARASLRAVGEPIDVVCVFRRPSEVAPHVDEAIAVGARTLWLQDGVIDPDSARRAHEAGLQVVMDRCMVRDHARLFGGRRSG
jgi:predicted CoA-binding protein